MRIGVLGTGTIATAVVHGIAGDGHQIVVSERSVANTSLLAAVYDEVSVAGNQAVLDQSDVVFLGLMAEVAEVMLPRLSFREDQRVISFMAGASKSEAAALVAPATLEAVVMPFPGIAEGGSPVLALGDAELLEEIFGARNTVYAVQSEAELAAYLSAQAVLSPVARMVETAGNWLAAREAVPGVGEAFLRHLVASNLQGTPSAELIEALNTEGGYNQRLRLHMEEGGMVQDLQGGMDALERGE
ncbi:NAD(P)-binding domain-containing protein [Shimia sediminis]|uniref:NAD(P)-binding domain-containing protein n=1 Tax=Shimia sediminis TaxID=2497945 RepID=UPI000F8DE617|nr:NAD(P)-binding domain-containing protein [Shimia sediminis]